MSIKSHFPHCPFRQIVEQMELNPTFKEFTDLSDELKVKYKDAMESCIKMECGGENYHEEGE